MKLTLKRAHGTANFTQGVLYINDKYFCETIEDEERKVKFAGKTAIPLGKYRVIINDSLRFKRKMPLLLGVPNFEGIRIHAGNTDADTQGCILIGKFEQNGFITKSRATFEIFFKILSDDYYHQQDIWIEIL